MRRDVESHAQEFHVWAWVQFALAGVIQYAQVPKEAQQSLGETVKLVVSLS